MSVAEPGMPPRGTSGRSWWRRILRYRIGLYLLIIVALLVWRQSGRIPGLGSFPGRTGPAAGPVTISGLDCAPALMPVLAAEYRRLYPKVDLRVLGGGSVQALEDLVNSRVDLALMTRPPTPEEKRIIKAAVDSVISYPVALGGIAVLSARDGGIDSVAVEDLADWFRGMNFETAEAPSALLVPDPNTGMWAALAEQLGVDEAEQERVTWLEDDHASARAAAGDARSIAFASLLALPRDLDRLGVKLVRVRARSFGKAALPGPAEISEGKYPLYQHLFLTFLPGVRTDAAAFVTFVYSGRGQRLVEREGHVPARQSARLVHLSQKPLG